MRISVITAVYNSETVLGKSIASVVTQTHGNLEHLIIEGKSADRSLIAIRNSAHERMRLISEPDLGIYDALNKGIKNATGDIIGFVHSDDYLAHDKVLARIANEFKDPTVDAVYSDLDYVSKANNEHVVRRWSNGPYRHGCLKNGWMPAHTTLYLRRSVFQNFGLFDTNYKISGDYDFILRYFSQTSGKSIYIPEVLYKMRLGGISNRNSKNIRLKMCEDLNAIRTNSVGGIKTLVFKNLSKINQFIIKPKQNNIIRTNANFSKIDKFDLQKSLGS